MGKLATIKTKPTASSVEDFISSIQDEQKRNDSLVVMKLMEKATKIKPKMWGSVMIGFGDVRYKSPASGREVSLHLIDLQRHTDALAKLGKHKTGMGCLYINKLADIDIKILEKIIMAAAK